MDVICHCLAETKKPIKRLIQVQIHVVFEGLGVENRLRFKSVLGSNLEQSSIHEAYPLYSLMK